MNHAASLPPTSSPLESPLQRGIAAAKRNAGPGFALAVLSISTGIAYALEGPARDAMTALAHWRNSLNGPAAWAFPAISTALFGGVIPWAVQRWRPAARRGLIRRPGLLALGFLVFFWAYKGMEIELLYTVLSKIVGDTASPQVVIGKILLDMSLYAPLWAVPSATVAYAWMDAGFSWAALRRGAFAQGVKSYIRREIIPIIISTWAIWVPAAAVIYSLPQALQLPLQNAVLCFWALMMVALTEQPAHPPTTPA